MADLFTPFIKNERHSELYQRASKLAVKVKERVKDSEESATFSIDNLRDLKADGYVSLPLPKAFGGEDLSLYELLLIQEKLAVGDGATALSIGWHMGVVMELSEQALWSDDKFIMIAKEISEQKAVLNRAATEPATGSPTRGGIPETKAIRNGDTYTINGRKTFTTMASVLDYFIVSAFVEDQGAVGWFLIHKDTPGIRVEHTWDTLGMRGTGSDDLVLENVVLKEDMLVEVNQKKKSAPKGWLLHIPACYLGIAIAARNDAIEFAKNFQPNSLKTPISEVPHVRQKIGEMDLKLMQARHFMYAIAERWDQYPEQRESLGAELAAVKTVATNIANEVVDLAMRIVGGRGLSKNLAFEQYYRDVRAGLHNPPMDDMVIQMLAGNALRD
ncbi:acyl-CoA/acyl-ACP dehydrogenase [Aquibacillus koreensis]|uniref:Acyl-CoA/acyl-ACP dehydrogenase n=1 Tax=Aquibacillus koreensis TaxID=279446 RepID=A0A9X3WKQ6_9BACI|nr:acyl-CoA dehydrogenase family protein [Aquibacillus koreensis]MCT2535952.1 acyl-CoA/acyl-ACP dehydrogenase [Aquibacillus koreensis]MDC3420408.1 acyl-CoA/acyl-ACP dehydrogenase [Aquibacillus koreensis]